MLKDENHAITTTLGFAKTKYPDTFNNMVIETGWYNMWSNLLLVRKPANNPVRV